MTYLGAITWDLKKLTSEFLTFELFIRVKPAGWIKRGLNDLDEIY